jgi:hypothetical protein
VSSVSLPLRVEQHVAPVADAGEQVAQIFEPVWRAHDVRVDDQRHDPRRLRRVLVELLELVDRPIVVFAGLVMLDHHIAVDLEDAVSAHLLAESMRRGSASAAISSAPRGHFPPTICRSCGMTPHW